MRRNEEGNINIYKYKHTERICLQLKRNFSVFRAKYIPGTFFWWDNVLHPQFLDRT